MFIQGAMKAVQRLKFTAFCKFPSGPLYQFLFSNMIINNLMVRSEVSDIKEI